MDYNSDIAISNIDNIVCVLNEGGMRTCREIAERLVELASDDQLDSKLNAPRNPDRRNVSYMEQQIRQEVRRSLNAHFGNPEETGFDIYRAASFREVERFWVAEEQFLANEDEDYEGSIHLEEMLEENDLVHMLDPDAPLIDNLIEANKNHDIKASRHLRDMSNLGNGSFFNPDMPSSLAEALTEHLSVEARENKYSVDQLSDRINIIVNKLEGRGE